MDERHIEEIRSSMAERVERVQREGGAESHDEIAAWMTVLVQDFTALTARVEALEASRRPGSS